MTEDRNRLPLRARNGSVRAYVQIDASDYDALNRWRWSLGAHGYAFRSPRGDRGQRTAVLLHRDLLGLKPGDPRQVDHINGDRLDCRRANLRVLPRRGNPQNTPGHRNSSSRYRGVIWDKVNCKWRAKVKLNGRTHELGRYSSEDEAGRVASAFRAEHMPYSRDALAAAEAPAVLGSRT